MHRLLTLPLAAALFACAGPAKPTAPARVVEPPPTGATGLEGTVTRGPVTPVCQVGVPCYAPFSAAFTVTQQQRVVASFRSDSAGRYQVLLAPGAYMVAPDSGAPVWPKGQVRSVTVGSVGLTHLDLQFDTGIR